IAITESTNGSANCAESFKKLRHCCCICCMRSSFCANDLVACRDTKIASNKRTFFIIFFLKVCKKRAVHAALVYLQHFYRNIRLISWFSCSLTHSHYKLSILPLIYHRLLINVFTGLAYNTILPLLFLLNNLWKQSFL